jgi:Zn-dependent protease
MYAQVYALLSVALFLLLFLYSVILHELAHGWVALKCGDTTARDQGRLSLNPLRHLDPLGTFILPIIMYMALGFFVAQARPVPVNLLRFTNLKGGTRLVSLAGVIVNFILAFIFLQVSKAFGHSPYLLAVFGLLAILNLILCLFNLIPIPPLDGSRFLRTFMPEQIARFYDMLEPFGLIIVIMLVYFGAFSGAIQAVFHFLWTTVLLGDGQLFRAIMLNAQQIIGALRS